MDACCSTSSLPTTTIYIPRSQGCLLWHFFTPLYDHINTLYVYVWLTVRTPTTLLLRSYTHPVRSSILAVCTPTTRSMYGHVHIAQHAMYGCYAALLYSHPRTMSRPPSTPWMLAVRTLLYSLHTTMHSPRTLCMLAARTLHAPM